MTFNMRNYTAVAVVILTTWLLIEGTQSQVTFSRDWNPGKRMVENSEYHNAFKTASTLCHVLINQIRQLASCENSRAEELDPSTTTIFSGGR